MNAFWSTHVRPWNGNGRFGLPCVPMVDADTSSSANTTRACLMPHSLNIQGGAAAAHSVRQQVVRDAQDVDVRYDADQSSLVDDGERADLAVDEDLGRALEGRATQHGDGLTRHQLTDSDRPQRVVVFVLSD